jgi:hypothetical protein
MALVLDEASLGTAFQGRLDIQNAVRAASTGELLCFRGLRFQRAHNYSRKKLHTKNTPDGKFWRGDMWYFKDIEANVYYENSRTTLCGTLQSDLTARLHSRPRQ